MEGEKCLRRSADEVSRKEGPFLSFSEPVFIGLNNITCDPITLIISVYENPLSR